MWSNEPDPGRSSPPMQMTSPSPGCQRARRAFLAVLGAGLFSLAHGAALHAQQTSGEKSLQRQQQRDAAIRRQDIHEQQRQRAASQQQQQATNPILRRQLKSSDAARHQQYLQERRRESTKYPDLPPAPLPAKRYPSSSSSAHTVPDQAPVPSSSTRLAPSPATSG